MMEKKKSIGILIVGVTQAVICLFIGVPGFFVGFSWFLLDIIAISTGGGGNLTGLGMIVGLPMAGLGVLFLWGLMATILLSRGNPQGRKFIVIFIGITTITLFWVPGIWMIPLSLFHLPSSIWLLLFIGIFNIASVVFLIHPKTKAQFVEGAPGFTSREIKIFISFLIIIFTISIVYAVFYSIKASISAKKQIVREEEESGARDEEILGKFKNSQYAALMVVCHIRHQDIETSNLEAQKEFAVKNIIQPLGMGNIRNYTFNNWGSSDVYFTADVTKAGYESLKQSKYLQAIYLKESFGKE